MSSSGSDVEASSSVEEAEVMRDFSAVERSCSPISHSIVLSPKVITTRYGTWSPTIPSRESTPSRDVVLREVSSSPRTRTSKRPSLEHIPPPRESPSPVSPKILHIEDETASSARVQRRGAKRKRVTKRVTKLKTFAKPQRIQRQQNNSNSSSPLGSPLPDLIIEMVPKRQDDEPPEVYEALLVSICEYLKANKLFCKRFDNRASRGDNSNRLSSPEGDVETPGFFKETEVMRSGPAITASVSPILQSALLSQIITKRSDSSHSSVVTPRPTFLTRRKQRSSHSTPLESHFSPQDLIPDSERLSSRHTINSSDDSEASSREEEDNTTDKILRAGVKRKTGDSDNKSSKSSRGSRGTMEETQASINSPARSSSSTATSSSSIPQSNPTQDLTPKETSPSRTSSPKVCSPADSNETESSAGEEEENSVASEDCEERDASPGDISSASKEQSESNSEEEVTYSGTATEESIKTVVQCTDNLEVEKNCVGKAKLYSPTLQSTASIIQETPDTFRRTSPILRSRSNIVQKTSPNSHRFLPSPVLQSTPRTATKSMSNPSVIPCKSSHDVTSKKSSTSTSLPHEEASPIDISSHNSQQSSAVSAGLEEDVSFTSEDSEKRDNSNRLSSPEGDVETPGFFKETEVMRSGPAITASVSPILQSALFSQIITKRSDSSHSAVVTPRPTFLTRRKQRSSHSTPLESHFSPQHLIPDPERLSSQHTINSSDDSEASSREEEDNTTDKILRAGVKRKTGDSDNKSSKSCQGSRGTMEETQASINSPARSSSSTATSSSSIPQSNPTQDLTPKETSPSRTPSPKVCSPADSNETESSAGEEEENSVASEDCEERDASPGDISSASKEQSESNSEEEVTYSATATEESIKTVVQCTDTLEVEKNCVGKPKLHSPTLQSTASIIRETPDTFRRTSPILQSRSNISQKTSPILHRFLPSPVLQSTSRTATKSMSNPSVIPCKSSHDVTSKKSYSTSTSLPHEEASPIDISSHNSQQSSAVSAGLEEEDVSFTSEDSEKRGATDASEADKAEETAESSDEEPISELNATISQSSYDEEIMSLMKSQIHKVNCPRRKKTKDESVQTLLI